MSWNDGDLVVGTVPLWAQIADKLRESIRDGEFVVGDHLPSESQLITRFGISRATARNALNQLAAEGLVERRSGKGTKVLPAQVELPLNLLASFSEDMIFRGLRPGYGEIEMIVGPLTQAAAQALEVEPGEDAIRLSRVLLANDVAMAHSTSWLSPRFVPVSSIGTQSDLLSSSLYSWLESEFGLRITHGTEIIEGDVADAHLAKQLGIAAKGPVLKVSRTARTVEGNPIEYVERSYRADRYRYRIELARP